MKKGSGHGIRTTPSRGAASLCVCNVLQAPVRASHRGVSTPTQPCASPHNPNPDAKALGRRYGRRMNVAMGGDLALSQMKAAPVLRVRTKVTTNTQTSITH